jgi:hypothetical protein
LQIWRDKEEKKRKTRKNQRKSETTKKTEVRKERKVFHLRSFHASLIVIIDDIKLQFTPVG